jgi:hypothetical protein
MGTDSPLIRRIRAEYAEWPGLKLTTAQVCRLWASDEKACSVALELLVAEGFLWRAPSGAYTLLPRPRGAALKSARPLDALATPTRCPHCRGLNTLTRELAAGNRPLTLRCVACQRIINATALSA